MIDMKAPAIFLSFDDLHLTEWLDYVPLFNNYNARVTFYIRSRHRYPYLPLSDFEFKQLQELEQQGHTIGFHTPTHKRATQFVAAYGCSEYKKLEILPELEALRKRGFNTRHFSYPYGNCNEETHKCLLEHFDTLRVATEYAGMRVYEPDSIGNEFILKAINIDEGTLRYIEHKVLKTEGVGFFYGHIPNKHRLKEVFELGNRYDAHFYPMSMLDKEEEA